MSSSHPLSFRYISKALSSARRSACVMSSIKNLASNVSKTCDCQTQLVDYKDLPIHGHSNRTEYCSKEESPPLPKVLLDRCEDLRPHGGASFAKGR